MTFSDFLRYQFESTRRAQLPPLATHNQAKTKQPERAAA